MLAFAAFVFLLITAVFWIPLLIGLATMAFLAILWLVPLAVGFGIWAGNGYDDGAAVVAVIVTVGLYFGLAHAFKE